MRVILLSLIVALFWAINPIIVKYVLQYTSLPLFLLITNITTFIAVLFIAYLYKETIINDLKNLSNKNISLIIANTLIFGFIAGILYLYLIQNHDVNVIISLTYMSPLFVVFLSKYILKEDISKSSYLGVFLIILGGILISIVKKNNKYLK
jgi:uncharacterized membrane protein